MILIIGPTFIVGLTLVVIFGSVAAVIVAISVMNRNRKLYEQAPEKHARGEVTKLITRERYSNISGLNTDPELEKWHYRKGNYLVQVLRDDGIFMLFSCGEKPYKKLIVGYYGQFTYKANILLDFRRNKSHELERQRMKEDKPYFFKNRETKGKTVGFEVEAPSFQIKILHDSMIQCDLDEVLEYAKHMFENTAENNFGLKDGERYIQFFNNGKDEVVWLDIPAKEKLGIYQGKIDRVEDLFEIIEAFFEEKNILDLIDTEFMDLNK